MEDSVVTPIWYVVAAMAILAPMIFVVVRYIANRVRDRKTQEIIAEDERLGKVPEVPEDFEPPEVVRRSRKGKSLRSQFR